MQSSDLTVEQLAFEVGMSVRNIRNHQSRGILPPPEVRSRVGYYGPAHVERLRLIQEMQAGGLKISAIVRLLGQGEEAVAHVVGLRRAVTSPVEAEAPEVLTLAELVERFGTSEPRVLEKAQKLGVLVALGEDTYEAPSPALLRAAEEVVARGLSLSATLDTLERVSRNAQSSSRAFVRLYLEQLWKPFDRAGRPEEQWPEVTESIERLRPLAAEAMTAVFRQTMAEEMARAFGEILESAPKRPGSAPRTKTSASPRPRQRARTRRPASSS